MVKPKGAILTAIALLALGCGPSNSSDSPDGAGGATCTAFDCSTLRSCSTLSATQCDGLCGCYADQWRPAAFSAFASCANQCVGVGDRYANCVVETSAAQPTFANGQYIANCDAKRSVCAAYPSDACDPVTLRLLSDQAFSDLEGCLGEPCDGSASACVSEVIYCGVTPP